MKSPKIFIFTTFMSLFAYSWCVWAHDDEDTVDQELARPTPTPQKKKDSIFDKKRPKDNWAETIRRKKERNNNLEENLDGLEESNQVNSPENSN